MGLDARGFRLEGAGLGQWTDNSNCLEGKEEVDHAEHEGRLLGLGGLGTLEGVSGLVVLPELRRRDLGVEDRGPDVPMPEEGLDVTEPGSPVQESGR